MLQLLGNVLVLRSDCLVEGIDEHFLLLVGLVRLRQLTLELLDLLLEVIVEVDAGLSDLDLLLPVLQLNLSLRGEQITDYALLLEPTFIVNGRRRCLVQIGILLRLATLLQRGCHLC